MMSDHNETSEPQEVQTQQDDLDMAKVQASMQGIRDQQERELQEDLEKYNNRPKPPWAEVNQEIDNASPTRGNEAVDDATQESLEEREVFVPPLGDEVKLRIHEIQRLPVEQRQQAVADFQHTKAGRQAGELNSGVMAGGKGVYFRDADGNQYDILYEENELG
jgi:hypothetical protein